MTLIKDFFFYTLYQPLYNLLVFLAWLIPGHSVGWAIVIIVVLIRILLLPTTAKALVLQKRIRRLQPKMAEIKEEYKGDMRGQQLALAELYKREKINPLAGCLPLLIQLPLFVVLFHVFNKGLDESQFGILYSFTPHMSDMNTMFFGIDLAQPDLWILPIITGVLQFIQSKQLLSKSKSKPGVAPDPQEMIMRQMTYFFPAMIFIFARTLPAALPLYWSINSLVSIIQQWYIMERQTEKLEEKMEELPEQTKPASKAPQASKADKKVYNRKKDTVVTIRKRKKNA